MKIAAIDIGGTNVSLYLFDDNMNILHKQTENSQKITSSQDLIEFIEKNAKGFDAIGIATAGSVDSESGFVHFAPNIDWLRDNPLRQTLESYFNVHVEVENDGNCFILGELKFGSCKGLSRIIGYTLGTGIGGGVIIDGRLLRGIGTSELGHISIDRNGLQCNCGKKGCLEAYCGGIWVSRFADLIAKDSENLDHSDIITTALSFYEKALEKDDFALFFWQKWGEILGMGIAQVVNVLRPEAVVLGGKITKASDFFLPAMIKSMKSHVFKPYDENMKVIISQLENAALFGAGTLVLSKIMKR